MADAIILGGGVAKGAFVAGALDVLMASGIADVRRIVATSSGAVNATYLASALHHGDGARAGRVLRALWIERGDALQVFDPSPLGMARLEGFSTLDKVRGLLERYVTPSPDPIPLILRLVLTTSTGAVTCGQGDAPATTYEHVASFGPRAFTSKGQLAHVFDAAVASSAFPVAFVPPVIERGGVRIACFDGGLVNNTPVKHAIDDEAVSRIFVIAPYPRVVPAPGPQLRGAELLAHLGEIVVHERLYRDVREAHAVNAALARVALAFPERRPREAVLRLFGWLGRRRIELVEIRPAVPLEGGAFSGFASRRLREAYVAAGEVAATAALAELADEAPPSQRCA